MRVERTFIRRARFEHVNEIDGIIAVQVSTGWKAFFSTEWDFRALDATTFLGKTLNLV